MVHIWIDKREQIDVLREAMHTVHILGKTVVLHSRLPSAAQIIACAADESARRIRKAILDDWCESGAGIWSELADMAAGKVEPVGLVPSGLRGNGVDTATVDELGASDRREAKASRKASRPRWRQ
jgi:hypothetical protein